jgi:hypothetical protein
MSEYKVRTLNAYIKEIESPHRSTSGINLSLKYFRGEAAQHDEIMSSALKYLAYEPQEKPVDIEKVCREFYNKVYLTLSEKEEKTFLSFCQHHGIETNLIDITTNPLVALYFACAERNGTKATTDDDDLSDGFVHCFDIRYIDITGLVKFDDCQLIKTEYIDMFLANKEKRTKLYTLYDNYRNSFKDHYAKPEQNKGYKKDIPGIKQRVDRFLDNLRDEDKFTPQKWREEVEKVINYLPPMIYSPLMTFKRALSQHSMFIFQQYIKLGSKYPYKKVTAEHKIIIPGKSKIKILESLEKFGINFSTIYDGYDNIAKYVMAENSTDEDSKFKLSKK